MRRVYRRRIRLFAFVVLLFVLILLGCAMFPSMAREEGPRPTAYYTSIQIEEGDSLWDIARSSFSTMEDIRELNQLEGDELTPQSSLILVKRVED